jgi:hypothetical protein
MIFHLIDDQNVQNDIVFRLGLLSAFSLICSGVPKNDIHRLEIMTATSVYYLVEKYIPDFKVIMSQDPNVASSFIDSFSDVVKSMANSMYLTCLNMDDPKHPHVDLNKVAGIRTKLFGLK